MSGFKLRYVMMFFYQDTLCVFLSSFKVLLFLPVFVGSSERHGVQMERQSPDRVKPSMKERAFEMRRFSIVQAGRASEELKEEPAKGAELASRFITPNFLRLLDTRLQT